jgi:hypothetical protein
LVESCVEVAVIAADPAAAGVKTPEEVIAPSVAVQVTAELKAPVPCTVATQEEVWFVWIEAGEQATETEVIVPGTPTATDAEPDLVESCVDVAVIVHVPAAEGVNTPADVIAPPVADHVTPEL